MSSGALEARSSRAKALRYLGHRGQEISEELEGRLAAMMDLCLEVASPRYAMLLCGCEMDAPNVHAGRTVIPLSHEELPASLSTVVAWGLIACTLGPAIDGRLVRLGATDSFDQVLFDACATAAIENLADDCEALVAGAALQYGLFAGQRISPGYGSLPLRTSLDIIQALDASKVIGLVSSDGALMPVKSVTALVPLFLDSKDALRAHRSCADCISRKGCRYRASGTTCYGDDIGQGSVLSK